MSVLIAHGPVFTHVEYNEAFSASIDGVYKKGSVSIVFAFCPSGWEEVKTVGEIWTSKPKNRMREKECHHEKLDGLALAISRGLSNRVIWTNEGKRDWDELGIDPSCVQEIYEHENGQQASYSSWLIPLGPDFKPLRTSYTFRAYDYPRAGKRRSKVHHITLNYRTFGTTRPGPYLQVTRTVTTRFGESEQQTVSNHVWLKWFNTEHAESLRVWRSSVENAERYGNGESVEVTNDRFGQLTDVDLTPFTVAVFAKALTRASSLEFKRLNYTTSPFVFPMLEHLPKMFKRTVDDLRWFTFNMNLYLRDLWFLKRSILPIVKLVRNPLSPKNWANAWLTYRYGIRLTYLDSVRLAEGLSRARKIGYALLNRVRARSSYRDESNNVYYTFNMKSWFFPEQAFHKILDGRPSALNLMDLIRILRTVDLIPSAYNVWDYIPYSFVVDWIVPVSDYLAQLDSGSDIQLYEMESMILTCKAVKRLDDAWFTCALEDVYSGAWDTPTLLGVHVHFVGDLTVYRRRIYDARRDRLRKEWQSRFPLGDFGDGLTLKTTVDSLALLVQRMRNPLKSTRRFSL